jgi:hypothetical protein
MAWHLLVMRRRGGRTMALENLIAYVIVLSLPLWLVAEELVHRVGPRLARRVRRASATGRASSPASTSGERRAPEGAPAHAHGSAS